MAALLSAALSVYRLFFPLLFSNITILRLKQLQTGSDSLFWRHPCVEKQLPILETSLQYCHCCRCCHDDLGGRPVNLPQFFSRVSEDYL